MNVPGRERGTRLRHYGPWAIGDGVLPSWGRPATHAADPQHRRRHYREYRQARDAPPLSKRMAARPLTPSTAIVGVATPISVRVRDRP